MVKKFACIYTMVNDEKELLPIWLKHYHKSFDWEDIYVYDHRTDDGSIVYSDDEKNDRFKPAGLQPDGIKHTHNLRTGRDHNLKCNVGKVWKVSIDKGYEPLWNFQWMQNFYRDQFNLLNKKYEYVVLAEIDDFFFVEPGKYDSLRDYLIKLKENKKPYARATGFELVHQPDKEPDINWNKKILSQRKYWMRYGMWDKTYISSEYLRWCEGYHFVHNNYDPPDPNLILCHLKRVDWKHYLKFRMKKNKDWNRFNKTKVAKFNDSEIKDLRKRVASVNFRKKWNIRNKQLCKRRDNRDTANIRGSIAKIPDRYRDVF